MTTIHRKQCDRCKADGEEQGFSGAAGWIEVRINRAPIAQTELVDLCPDCSVDFWRFVNGQLADPPAEPPPDTNRSPDASCVDARAVEPSS